LSATITVDMVGWQKQVAWLSLNWGIEARFVMYEVMRLFVKGIQNRLPAARKGGGRGFGTEATDWKGAGASGYKGPIQQDLSRIFVPISDASQLSEVTNIGGRDVRIFRYEGQRGGAGRANKGRMGAAWLVDTQDYDPTGSRMGQHHMRNRVANGRVTRAGSYDRRIGRWKAIEKLHVPMAAYRSYLRELLTHVGKLKASMNAGVNLFSRLSNAAGSTPSFVSRHGERYSAAKDAMTKDGGGYLEARSYLPWSGRFDSLVRFEASLREKDLSTHFEKRMRRLADRWNSMRAA